MGDPQSLFKGKLSSIRLTPENKKTGRLAEAILHLDRQYAMPSNPDLYNRCLQLQSEFDLLSTNKAELLLLKSKQGVFEYGDTANRLLAQQAHSAASSRFIKQIVSPSGDILISPIDINKAF